MPTEERLQSWWVRKPIEWVAVAALGIVGTLIVQDIGTQRRTLTYAFTSSSLLDPVVSSMEGMTLSIGEDIIPEPYLVTLSISNTGNAEITNTDLYVLLHQKVRSYFLATDRPAVRNGLQWSGIDDGVQIKIPTLNEADLLSFVFVLDGAPTDNPSLDAASPGLRLKESSTTTSKTSNDLVGIALIIGGLACFLVVVKILDPALDRIVSGVDQTAEQIADTIWSRLGILKKHDPTEDDATPDSESPSE